MAKSTKNFWGKFLTKISSFLAFILFVVTKSAKTFFGNFFDENILIFDVHIIPITERCKNNFSMIFLLFFPCAFRASSEVIRGVEAAVTHELEAMLTQIKFEDEL